ncbi:MAG TPA: ATP-binding protein [Spirochaetia bacterium]|nr:ATP-binding protein [Spirochaetia bacterium]
MQPETGDTVPRRGLTRRLNLRVWGLGLLACALVLFLVAWQAAAEREDRLERERDALSRLAQSASADFHEKLERIRLFFRIADLWLAAQPEADPRTDPAFGRLVDSFRSSMGNKLDIRLISAAGGLYYVPAASPEPLADLRDRDYYRAQLDPAIRGFYIGKPVVGRVTGLLTIPVAYPISRGNAGMAVLFAALALPDIEATYEPIRPKPNGSLAITRGDGLLLARVPLDEAAIGKAVTPDTAAWRSSVYADPTQVRDLRSSVDGKRRLIAFSARRDPDIVVSVSALYDDVLAPWRASLWLRALIAAVMIGAIALSSARAAAVLRSLDAAHAELEGNLRLLKRSDAAKDKLFSIVAHDLRGPIGGMCNLLETIATDREGIDRESLDEFIGALRQASWNSYQLLENLLAWSRSQQGELRFAPARVELRPLVEECLQAYALSIGDKGLEVAIEVEAGLAARADPELLKVVLRNLLSNAVKFSRRGGRIRIEASAAAGGTAISVADEGIGMGPEELASLFDLGAVRSRAGTVNERGSGLGLALSKEIAERHGGRLEAASVEGAGSRFELFLPDEGPAPSPAAPEGEASS